MCLGALAVVASRGDLWRADLAALSPLPAEVLALEIDRHLIAPLTETLAAVGSRLAHEFQVPFVATNEPYFGKPEMFEAHDALRDMID